MNNDSMSYVFSDLLPTDLQILSSIASCEQAKPGTTLISQGTQNPGLLFVQEGNVSVQVTSRGFRKELVRCSGPNIFGEMSLLTNNATNADVIASSSVELMRMPAQALQNTFVTHPGLMTRLYKSLASKVVERLSESKTRSFPTQGAGFLQDMEETWKEVLTDIQQISFSPFIRRYVERYEEVGERDAYLWRWAIRGLELTQLSIVPDELAGEIGDTKLLAVILNVLLDDLADERGSEELLEAALAMIGSQSDTLPPIVPAEDRAYFQLILDLWQDIRKRCESLPGWSTFRMLLDFDYRQVFSAMRYGLLLHHHPALLNPSEHELYPPHNMNMMVFGCLDLMSIPNFPADELGSLREVLWKAQSMGQLSNMIVTWEREVPDRDFSSRIFALALSQGLFHPSELQTLKPETIISTVREAGIEEQLFSQWENLSQSIRAFSHRLPSIDLDQLLDGLHVLLGMTLASRYRL